MSFRRTSIGNDVELALGGLRLHGILEVPEEPIGLVAFAHGSGSSRLSPRNLAVATALHARGLATLLFDLLTPEEERDRSNVFDIDLLSNRLASATAWLRPRREVTGLAIGYFGASTGAAAALRTAADLGEGVGAVVSRGGRVDLARPRLADVRAPTLMIVGSRDAVVLELNREALAELRCEARLEVVPGAGHLFEEPGALDSVSELAADWFVEHLRGRRAEAGSQA